MVKMNKKGIIGNIIGTIVVALVLFIIFYPAIKSDARDRLMYDEWKNFCDERPAFCYCDIRSCDFHIEYNNNTPSKETKEYCELAKELNDKQAFFNGRCKVE